MDFLTYTRRSGSDERGKEYQIKLATLFVLRLSVDPDVKDLWIGTNLNHVGCFYQVVIGVIKFSGENIAYLIQPRHQEIRNVLQSKDFESSKGTYSLEKFCVDRKELKRKTSDSSIEVMDYLRKCDKVYQIMFTNRPLEESKEGMDYWDYDNSSLAKTLDTSPDRSVFKLNRQKWIRKDDDFLNHFLLFANQVQVKDVDVVVESEMGRLVGLTNSKSAAQELIAFMTSWTTNGPSSKASKEATFYTLTKLDIVNKAVSIVLEKYSKMFFEKDYFSFYDVDSSKYIWNKLVRTSNVTVTENEDTIRNFLASYLASEISGWIKNIENGKRKWCDQLTKQQQVDVLKNILNAMTKTLNIDTKLSLNDIYKCLWLSHKIPLLLTIDTLEDYRQVCEVLTLSRCKLSVIILVSDNEVLQSQTTSLNPTISLQDVSVTLQQEILDLTTNLQERPVCLKDIINEDVFRHLKCKDIIHILNSSYNIGNKLENLPEYFIKQSISKVYLNYDVLKALKDDLFLIENHENVMSIDTNCLAWEGGNDLDVFKLNDKDTHRIWYCNDFYLQWKNTLGSIKKIREYRRSNIFQTSFEEISLMTFDPRDAWNDIQSVMESSYNQVIIVSADPGMGKSVLTNFIASIATTSFWVLKINLVDFEDEFAKLVKMDVASKLKRLNNIILDKDGCPNLNLASKIFEKYLESKRVLVLLDGFDEISVLYKSEVTDLAVKIYKDGFKLWITTRPVMATHLEDMFDAMSVFLSPFSVEQQKNYLISYFRDVSTPPKNKEEFLVKYVDQLLISIKKSFSKGEFSNFNGVPLQIKFVAEVFAKHYKNALSAEVTKFEENLDILYLYEEFCKNKINILVEKYGKDAKRTRIIFIRYQQLYAIKLIFSETHLKGFDLDGALEQYTVDKSEEMHFLQREGILVMHQYPDKYTYKFNVKFVHRSFAEFLAAQWLAQQIVSNNDPSTIKVVRNLVKCRFIDYISPFTFLMFDHILARDFSMHRQIINGEVPDLGTTMDIDTSAVDKGGRSLLHIMSLNGVKHTFKKIPVNEKFEKLVDQVKCCPNEKDKVLNYNSLDYALRSYSLVLANKLCELYQPTINVKKRDCSDCIFMCCVFGYKHLFLSFLRQFGPRAILDPVNKNLSIYEFCFTSKVDSPEYLKEFIEELKCEILLDFFKVKTSNSDNDIVTEDRYDDLRLAVSHGTIENVNELFSSYDKDINQQDLDKNTLLFYACLFKRKEMIKLLLSKGAEVNRPSSNGDTALHVAARNGSQDMITILIEHGGDLNRLNDKKRTPLFYAAGWSVVFEYLVNAGAILNKVDSEGCALLHIVALKGLNEFLKKILKCYPTMINKQTCRGETPLMLACKDGRSDCVKVLLQNDALLDKVDVNGNTSLHYASQTNIIEIIVDILTKDKSCINIRNKGGETPLMLAIKCQEKEVVSLLVSNGGDSNQEDLEGNVPFHMAVKEGWTEIVIAMLLCGASTNKKDGKNRNPLHVALFHSKSVIAQIMLDLGTDVHSIDNEGNTCLHYAVTFFRDTHFLTELLKKEVDVNVPNGLKMTPLFNALSFYNLEAVETLLAFGAEWNTVDLAGRTALHIASQDDHIGLIKFFIDNGADIDKQDVQGSTPLHFACKNGKVSAIKILLDSSANVNVQNVQMKTALHVGVKDKIFKDKNTYSQHLSSLVLLLNQGADVNVQDRYGNTALHYACQLKNKPFPLNEKETDFIILNFYIPVTVLLLKYGADKDILNIERKSAIDLAKKAEYDSLVELLENPEEYMQYVTF